MGLMKRLHTARVFGVPTTEPKQTTAFDHLKGESGREKRGRIRSQRTSAPLGTEITLALGFGEDQ